jgi:hypothetical protein
VGNDLSSQFYEWNVNMNTGSALVRIERSIEWIYISLLLAHTVDRTTEIKVSVNGIFFFFAQVFLSTIASCISEDRSLAKEIVSLLLCIQLFLDRTVFDANYFWSAEFHTKQRCCYFQIHLRKGFFDEWCSEEVGRLLRRRSLPIAIAFDCFISLEFSFY